MARYAFSAWIPDRQRGKDVAEIISKRSDEWSKERKTKGKEGFTFVCWMGGEGQLMVGQQAAAKKISLKSDDQVYIIGHHDAGLDFIVDIEHEEQEEKRGKKADKKQYKAIKLKPEDLVLRFHNCFHGSSSFRGKIKFFNCSSGVNGGVSFAKPAADRMRAFWPKAQYLGYEDTLAQQYGDYTPNDGLSDLRALLAGFEGYEAPRPQRRKLGLTTGKRAKDLQILL